MHKYLLIINNQLMKSLYSWWNYFFHNNYMMIKYTKMIENDTWYIIVKQRNTSPLR